MGRKPSRRDRATLRAFLYGRVVAASATFFLKGFQRTRPRRLFVERAVRVSALLCAVRRIPLYEIGTDANFESQPNSIVFIVTENEDLMFPRKSRSPSPLLQTGQDARITPAVLHITFRTHDAPEPDHLAPSSEAVLAPGDGVWLPYHYRAASPGASLPDAPSA